MTLGSAVLDLVTTVFGVLMDVIELVTGSAD